MLGRQECWITTALDATEGLQAVLLARSMKRVMTSKSLVVLVNPSLPEELWQILQTEFDVCLRLDLDEVKRCAMAVSDYARCYGWSLEKYSKCIFLEPSSIVVRNGDGLFMVEVDDESLSSCIMTPNAKRWNEIIDSKDLILNEIAKSTMEQKFFTCVNVEEDILTLNKDELYILRFIKTLPLDMISRYAATNPSEYSNLGYIEQNLIQLLVDLVKDMAIVYQTYLQKVPLNGLKNTFETLSNAPYPVKNKTFEDAQSAVAVVGISCRFPGANNLDEFWKILCEGKDAIGNPPVGHWAKEKCPKFVEEAMKSQAGFLNWKNDDFDGKFFGVSPMEASLMDPQQRLTLQVAWEALEDAGIDPTSLKNTLTGVYGGAWRTDYKEAIQDAGLSETEFFRTYMGNSLGVLTARISHFLGLTGPSIATESGCSTSMVAVDLACKSLLKGESNLSLACGVNLLIHPFTGKHMNTVLAPDGHCKTFDEKADGFARAEGCGVLILKRYADAVEDGDRVYGLIRGSAVVQEGASRSLGTPTKYCEALAMKLALQDAGVHPKEVSFVETHGTGTPVGDPLEVAAVAEVYSKGRSDTLTIGSVKTNIGHTESCSGIAGIIKVILSLQHEQIPPHRNFDTLNPAIDLESIPAQIPLTAQEWKTSSSGKPRIAGVSSFGITGTDAHAILQEAPLNPHRDFFVHSSQKMSSHVLTLSAKSKEALEESIKRFQGYLKGTREDIHNIAFTSAVGRAHLEFRSAVVGSSVSEWSQKLSQVTDGNPVDKEPKVCFLFTGQGSQYPGMGKSLYETYPTFQMNFDKCDRILSRKYGINLREAMWGSESGMLSRTIYSQTSIFVVEYCLLKLWESWGVKPDYVLGHSLGEFGAAVAAGILSFEGALRLVADRSRLIDSLAGGKMLVLKENSEKVEQLKKVAFDGTDGWLDFAAINSPEQTVLAGSEDNVTKFAAFCKNNQIKTHILDATHAFHSRHMDSILEEYRRVASQVEYSQPHCVFVSGMEGRVVDEDGHVNADYWVRHTRDSVRFATASKAILELGCTHFLEVGPQPVLSALIMINSDGVPNLQGPLSCLPSIRKQDEDILCISNTIAKMYMSGININWKRFHQFQKVKKVALPFYPFQNKSTWFEIPDGPTRIHPLLGTPVPNAAEVILFNNQVELDRMEYLRDHVIGNQVVFPGAGYLEMCLVAGIASSQSTPTSNLEFRGSICVSDFLIESPFRLAEGEKFQTQVSVITNEDHKLVATVFSRICLDDGSKKWQKHASGVVCSSVPIDTEQDTLEDIRKRCVVPVGEDGRSKETFGLHFGPKFSTRRNQWENKEETEMLIETAVTEVSEGYVCHPILVDAMLQAIVLTTYKELQALYVPVAISKFELFKKLKEEETCYIHCRYDENNEVTARLFESSGTLIAEMKGATLVETSVGAVMSAIEAQKMCLPRMFEDVWKPMLGPLEKRADLLQCFNQAVFEKDTIESFDKKHSKMTDEDREFTQKSNKLYGFYMMKALYDFEWSPTLGNEYNIKDLVNQFKVLPALEGFLRYMLMELSAVEGHFEIVDPTREQMTFRYVKALPLLIEVQANIEAEYAEVQPQSIEVDIVSNTGKRLSTFLTGKESALPLLFPEDPSEVSAEVYYMDAKMCSSGHRLIYDLMKTLLRPELLENKAIIRVLEVGAGTGSFTKTLLPYMTGSPASWEFTYTDLSPVFFQNGQKIFEGSNINVHYRILNVEEDPATQGFVPQHYDLIVANNVLHVTLSISETVGNLRNLLRDDGILIISESIKPSRPTNLTFGILDAYWRFEDFDLRDYNCEISLEKWSRVLQSRNFDEISPLSSFDGMYGLITAKAAAQCKYSPLPAVAMKRKSCAWIVFSDDQPISTCYQENLAALGHQVVTVKRTSGDFQQTDEFSFLVNVEDDSHIPKVLHNVTKERSLALDGVVFLWGTDASLSAYSPLIRPFLALCKGLIPFDNPKVQVVTRGVVSIGDSEVSPPLSSPLWAMTKCLQNELPNSSCRVVDISLEAELSGPAFEESFAELFINDNEVYVAYRDHQRHVLRSNNWKPPNAALSFPKSDRFHLVLPPTNAISDLRFGPMSKESVLDDQVEVRVKSYALNFRDIFVVLKPTPEFQKFNTVGIDFAGVITAVGPAVSKYKLGDAVLGCNLNGGSLPSHIVTSERLVIGVPDSMTFNEAATLPAVAATAFLSLIQVAKLSSKDTILIHTGSGGVGLVAIQIAKSLGAKIVTTAGSRRKRKYLRSLGVEHVFHSRNTSYETEIRKALNGGGVDIVLNSLTSEGFKEASLAVCNEGARFIEMSKLNVWKPEEVKSLRPDVKYDIVDLSASTEEQMVELLREIEEYMSNSVIRPIPHTRFDVSEVRDAMAYFQKAKHIGKLICTMPDPDMGKSPTAGSNIPMFNERSTYLVTGGLGGIGLEVAKWMSHSGAKHIALVGRSFPNERAAEEIRRLNATGGNVFALQVDIGDFEQCKKMLETLKSSDLPPLRGIMHAAGVLSDAVYVNQSWGKYTTTFNPKVGGGLHLHQLTLNYPLEHFVMFSSMAGSLGALGQSNHSAANFFLDSLAHYRNSLGLPASTVNWGIWGQVGVAADMEILGWKKFSPLQGISALEKSMKCNKSQCSVFEADFSLVKEYLCSNAKYFSDLKIKQNEGLREMKVDNEQFWKDYESAEDSAEKLEVVKRFVRSMVRQMLKLGKDDPMGDSDNFQDLGMDSLMMIEMKNVVQSVFGSRATISVSSLKNCYTVNELSERLVSVLNEEGDAVDQTREEFIQLMRDDSTLPTNIVASGSPPCLPSEVRSVLITGATGNMGPYFVRDVSKLHHVQTIYCLVRKGKDTSLAGKLERILKSKDLLEDTVMTKVRCIDGAITKPKLGLSETDFNTLAEEVDAVVHMAVKSNYSEEYRKYKNQRDSDIRSVNVLGTLNILEFICAAKTKLLFHASSIVASAKLTEDKKMPETWPSAGEFDAMPNAAYPISKYVCDVLLGQAVERGLPVKVFRFPVVGGDSRTGGNVSYENNQVMLRMMAYMTLQAMPSIITPLPIVPVDVCTAISLEVFFNDEAPNDIYNVYSPFISEETCLVEIAEELGLNVTVVGIPELRKKLEAAENSPLMQSLNVWSSNTEMQDKLIVQGVHAIAEAFMTNPQTAFFSQKLSVLVPNYPAVMESTSSILKRDLLYAKRSGIFEKLGVGK